MSIEATERTEIIKLIVLMFNAAPGATYLGEVVAVYESLGKNLGALANVLDDIPLYQTLNPNFQTGPEFAAKFLTPLGLQNDALAIDFIVSRYEAGVPKGQIVYEAYLALALVGAGGAASQYENAFAILENKTAVAEYYSAIAGVNQLDFGILQLVLDGVTGDPDTVAQAIAEINDGTRGTSGIEATLTPSQDTVTGVNASDTVHGLFGDAVAGNNTYTAGDSIDLGNGVDRLNLVAMGAIASPAVIVKNVEFINVLDTVGATFNALLAENNPTITFSNTVAGQNSTVTNGALSSVMALEGKGNLVVDYASTAGKADAASVSINGVGTSASARSTINVADGNTVEKVTLATTGANFITLTGGTVAASLVITGDGTNNISLAAADSLAAVSTVDASASTGANTFALGGNLNTGTSIKGGSGADTVSATLASPTLVGPTLSGVETLNTTFTGGAVVDLSTATGLATIGVSASTAAMTFMNAQASVTSLNVTSLTTADSALKFGYDASTKGSLALRIGSATGAVDLGNVDLSNTTALAISTVGALAQNAGIVTVTGHQTSLTVSTAADSSLTWQQLVVKGDVDSYTTTVGADSSFSTFSGYSSIVGDLGSRTVAVAEGGSFSEQVTADNVGDVAVDVTGDDASAFQTVAVFGGGEIGNLTGTLLGDDSAIGLGAFSSGGGSVGDLTMTLTGDGSHGQLAAFTFMSGYTAGGHIGNLTATINGNDTHFSGYAFAVGGDVGNLSVTVIGDDSSAELTSFAVAAAEEMAPASIESIGVYAQGGNIGDITLTVDGNDAHGVVRALSMGGNVGDITVSIDGEDAGGGVLVQTVQAPFSGAPNGDVGDFSLTVGDGASFSGYFVASGASNMGDISVNVGDDAVVNLTMERDGGEIGTTDVVAGSDSMLRLNYETTGSGSSGSSGGSGSGFGASGAGFGALATSGGTTEVDAVTATFGDGSHMSMNVSGMFDFGDITATFGDDGSFSGYWSTAGSGGVSSLVMPDPHVIGNITMTFGDGGNFGLGMTNGSVDIGDITLEFGDNGDFELSQYFFSNGNVGDIFGTFGSDSAFTYQVSGAGGSGLTIGSISLTFEGGASAGFGIEPWSSAHYSSIGAVSFVGGDDSSNARVDLGASGLSVDSMGGVDASAWGGYVNVDLASVALGTTVRVGADGSWVRGTEGADNIFLGAGLDMVQFDTSPTTTDVIFAFTVGAGKDILGLPAGPSVTLKAVMTADAAATAVTNDVYRLVDITGGQDITTAAGLITALESGEYLSVNQTASNHFTIITSASATASTLYVFDVIDDGDAVFETGEVVLVGVVNASAAGAIGNLVAGNLQSLA
ncbi:MAG TPA: hypothetical protein VK981_02855 [Ramlibacter sp.]|nr:hypothetical protein [Ramlibacter sp.]